jgi:acetylornithine aminotransferase
VPGFVRVPLNDIAAVRQVAAQERSVVAVLVEPIQGEGGINLSTMQYLRELRELCDRQGWFLMVDEVQCGLGRTGKWFVYEHAGVRPDVVLLAKGLASGVPIGACLARGTAAGVFKPGTHGSTFGGNPLACAAALATLEAIEEEGLMENAARVGAMLLAGLREALAGRPGVVEVRGHGLMIGVELDRPCGELVGRALEAGLLINVTMDNVIRLLPPLIMNEGEAGQVLAILVPLVRAFLAQAPSAVAARA